jgi:lipoprotein-anchoring transpeptidase ErfK/SrfK
MAGDLAMRGMFALVLAAGAAAGAALLMWEDGSGDSSRPDDPQNLLMLDPPDPGPAPGPGGALQTGTSPDAHAEAISARVLEHLNKGRPDLAAKVVLAGEAGVLSDAELRRRVFRTAETLANDASKSSGERGTQARLDARRLYAALYDCDASTDAELAKALDASRALHRSLVVGAAAPDALVIRHKFKSGENLWNLAKGPWKRAGISVAPGYVLEINGISDARRIRAGQTVRVPRERLSLLIRRDKRTLTVLLGGAPVETFVVGVGASESTPAGSFTIETKIKNPPWYYDGRKIPFGHPENVIGTRWMGFSDTRDAEGIGIHGTVDESTVGEAVSLGCIRMKRVDVERLFEWLPHGCGVEVR